MGFTEYFRRKTYGPKIGVAALSFDNGKPMAVLSRNEAYDLSRIFVRSFDGGYLIGNSSNVYTDNEGKLCERHISARSTLSILASKKYFSFSDKGVQYTFFCREPNLYDVHRIQRAVAQEKETVEKEFIGAY